MTDKLHEIVKEWGAKLEEPYFVLSVGGSLAFTLFTNTGALVTQCLVYIFHRAEGRTKFLDGCVLKTEGEEVGENGWAYAVVRVPVSAQNQRDEVGALLNGGLERLKALQA